MKRILYSLYGIGCYVLGLVSLVGFALFANNLFGVVAGEKYVSLNIDAYNSAPSDHAVWINIGLIVLFGMQHSVMARASFKEKLAKVLPPSLERSTYVLATAIVLIPLVQFWQPMTSISLWIISNPTACWFINGIYLGGYMITVAATYMINHNHLFGLQQSMNLAAVDKEFRTPGFYKYVRHPIQTGVLIAMLATPNMSLGRALLAAGIIAYIFIGLYFEEKSLMAEFGDDYRDYKKRIPALLPIKWKKYAQ